MNKKSILVLHKICPFAERVWITLEQKNVPHELRQVSLIEKQPFFTQTYKKAYGHDPNSDGKVPILIQDSRILVESDLISWYLAQKYTTGSKLIPDDPFDRLRMREFIQTHGKIIGKFYGFIGFKSKSKQDQQKHLSSVQSVLQRLQNSLQLPYALGNDFTLADIQIYPWLARWCAIQKRIGYGINQKYVKIRKWLNNIKQRNSVKVTCQTDQYYITGYQGYFK